MKAPPEAIRSKRTPLPASAYDPRYREVFLRGRMEAFVLSFDSANDAIKFHQRAQQYRKAVQREGQRELSDLLYQVTIRRDREDARKLVIEPADAQFDAVFRAVGTTSVGSLPAGPVEGDLRNPAVVGTPTNPTPERDGPGPSVTSEPTPEADLMRDIEMFEGEPE